MSNTFVSTKVDYQAILDALINKTNEVYQKWGHRHALQAADHVIIREYRTVGFMVGRQCGSSSALLEFITRHGKESCLAIFKDGYIQRDMSERYNAIKGETTPLNYLLIEQVRRYIKFSGKDYKNTVDPNFLAGLKYILVDEASYILNLRGVTDKEFNQWVAETFGHGIMVIRFS